jgi:hypothetical protein
VKWLRQAHYNSTQIMPAFTGVNPYIALAGQTPTMDGANWNAYHSSEGNIPSTEETTQGDQ